MTLSRRELLIAGAALAAAPAPVHARRRRPGALLPSARSVLAGGRELHELSSVQTIALLRAREVSSRDLVSAALARIDAVNGRRSFAGDPRSVNAWIRVYGERALADARRADRALARRGRAPLLTGLPVGLKDLFAVRGLGLTASSRVLHGHVASRDCTAWTRLDASGALLLGHTHTHEFALGAVTPQVGNPSSPARIAGGSSGGSAAAVGAEMVSLALGTDTSGSLRVPAAACGVLSLKPTYGRVPVTGVIPLAPSLDTVGPVARTTQDLALGWAVLAGRDPRAALAATTTLSRRKRPLAGIRIGLPSVPADESLSPQVLRAQQTLRSRLRKLGATLVPVAGPPDDTGVGILAFEALAYHRRRLGRVPGRFGADVRATLTLFRDLAVTPAAHEAAQRRRAVLQRRWRAVLREHRFDALLQPVLTAPPPPRTDTAAGERLTLSLFDFLATWNNVGFPVLTLPAAARNGPSVGTQLIGPPDSEPRLLAISEAVERRTR